MNKVSIIGENLGVVDEEIEYTSVEELAAVISTHNWAPGVFKDSRRTIASLSSTNLLVLDVDDGCTLEDAVERFKDYKHIIATSRNHQKEKKGLTHDRFRVVLFLDGSIDTDSDFKATWDTAAKRWSFIDTACKDSSRFFYVSPTIISINKTGREYPVSIQAIKQVSQLPSPLVVEPQERGELWRETWKLLAEGAPAGTRHTRLVSAVANMKEQGYPLPELTAMLQEMTETKDWTQPGLSAVDLRTINKVYERETKYPFRPQETEKLDSGVIVNASELLKDTFAYLSDKDKVKGDPTGIDGLDSLLGGGTRSGELTVLMAQAKTGKNTLLHYLAFKRLQAGAGIGYASRELSPAEEVLPNLLSIALKRNAWTSNIDTQLVSQSEAVVSTWNLYFAPGYGYFSVDAIETWMRTLKDIGVNEFIFDHFHYALQSEDYESTARLIKHLKTLTKSLDVHLYLIVQPRSLREGESLNLATLRGGAAIGQALDNLLILERVRGESNISRLRLDQARHKLAKLGEVFLSYDSETTSFTEVERSQVIEAPMPQGIGQSNGRPWPRVN